MDDSTQDFVQNFTNLPENNKEGVLRGLINSLDTSNSIDLIELLVQEGLAAAGNDKEYVLIGLINSLDTDDVMDINLLGLLVELGTNILERRTQHLLNLASAPLMGETETETQAGMEQEGARLQPDSQIRREAEAAIGEEIQRQQREQAGMEQEGEDSQEARNREYRQRGEAAREDAIFENLAARFDNLRARDVSDTNVDPTPSNQLDVSVEVGDAPNLYQETFPPGQASQLGESLDQEWRSLPRAFSMESEEDTGPVIDDVLRDVNPMEEHDNRLNYGQLPKKPKRTKRKKKKKKPYEDLIITQKKRLAKLQKMSEKLSKKMSKTKKKKRKKKVSDSY